MDLGKTEEIVSIQRIDGSLKRESVCEKSKVEYCSQMD